MKPLLLSILLLITASGMAQKQINGTNNTERVFVFGGSDTVTFKLSQETHFIKIIFQNGSFKIFQIIEHDPTIEEVPKQNEIMHQWPQGWNWSLPTWPPNVIPAGNDSILLKQPVNYNK